MKTFIALCLAASLLGGCASTKQLVDQGTVVKYKYVLMTIPNEMLVIPEVERTLDTTTATDKDTAKWMIDWERRYQEIEKRLKTIKIYQDRRIRELTLPPEDVIKN
jgi:hypothetical protein